MNHSTQVHANPDIFLVRVPFSRVVTGFTNCFVVWDSGEFLIVDVGGIPRGSRDADGAQEAMRSALRELGVDWTRTKVFLTHLHLDHAGLLEDVVPKGVPVHVSGLNIDIARMQASKDYSQGLRRRFFEGGFSETFRNGIERTFPYAGYEIDAARPVRRVRGGDALTVGRYTFDAVETPGHTTGHTSLFEFESRCMIGGDTVLFVLNPVIGIDFADASALTGYIAGLRRMQGLGLHRLLYAHGPITPLEALDLPKGSEGRFQDADPQGIDERIRFLIDHHMQRAENALEVVRSHPGSTARSIIFDMVWSVGSLDWARVPFSIRVCVAAEGFAVLDHLVGEGLVRFDFDSEGIRRYVPA